MKQVDEAARALVTMDIKDDGRVELTGASWKARQQYMFKAGVSWALQNHPDVVELVKVAKNIERLLRYPPESHLSKTIARFENGQADV